VWSIAAWRDVIADVTRYHKNLQCIECPKRSTTTRSATRRNYLILLASLHTLCQDRLRHDLTIAGELD